MTIEANKDILQKYQSGFRRKYSTDLCLGVILIDLKKALGTINHNMLLEKLRASGFCDDIINWFHSDLTDPAFLVCIENEYSSITTISIEVP